MFGSRRYHLIFHCSIYKLNRDPFLQHVGYIILNINEMNKIDKIQMFMLKEFVGYVVKIISAIIQIRHDRMFVKT